MANVLCGQTCLPLSASSYLGEAEGDQVDRRRPRGPRRGGFGYRGGYRPRGPPRRRNEGEVG